MLGNFSCFCCHLLSADLFQNQLFKKILSGTLSEHQTVLSVLIWVQIICKSYLEMTKVAPSKERVNLMQIYRLKCFLFKSVETKKLRMQKTKFLKPHTVLRI